MTNQSKVKSKLNNTKKSYGILCTRYNHITKKVEFLLIQKRSTFSFIEFVLKHHNKHDENKLLYLFDHMTYDEKTDILSLDFSRMWYRIWMVNPESQNAPDYLKLTPERYEKYKICKNNFEKTFMQDKGKKLRELISKSKDAETIWELPKGRKSSPQEKDLVCAIREFEEETGIPSSEYIILDDEPYVTTSQAMNVKYINFYYLAIANMHNNKISKPKLNYNNLAQISEVSAIKWMDLDQISLVDDNRKLYHLARGINKVLRKRYKIKKLAELDLIDPINLSLNDNCE